MSKMKLLVLVFVSFVKLSFCEFKVPNATVEVYEPRGLKVSIPHVDGIQLFAFHGQVNEEMDFRAGGKLSKDIREPENGRWTFYDAYAKLKIGDVLYYWTYVDYNDGTHTLGYTNDDNAYVVSQLIPKQRPTPAPPQPTVTSRAPEVVTLPEGCKQSATTSNNEKVCAEKLIFEDDFNSFQKKLWSPEVKFAGAPDYEFVIYTNNAKNRKVKDGHLKIHPIPSDELFGEGFSTTQDQIDLGPNCTGIHGTSECVQKPVAFLILPPVASSQISTKNKFSFKFGKVEIRAKLPKGDWIYPELYLNPVKDEYGPGYASGQIRIAFVPGNHNFNRDLKGGFVLGGSQAGRSYGMRTLKKTDGNWCDYFHTFTLVWKPDQITVSVDDTVYGNMYAPPGGFVSESSNLDLGDVDRWRSGSPFAPFDKEMFLTIGVGVGGHSFEDRNDNVKPWKNDDAKSQKNFYRAMPQWRSTWSNASVLDVDYIKVWAL